MPPKRKSRRTARRAMLPVVYGVVLIGLILLATLRGRPGEEAVYGSLDGRFDSDVRLEADGRTYVYREMETTNYLLIGVDDADGDRAEFTGGGQADFLVLLCVDRRNRSITPVMVDRDTVAEVTTYGVFGHESGRREMQICLAQAFHGQGQTGSANTVGVLTGLLGGVRIDHYMAVDIDGIGILNDAIGGVRVTLTDDFTALDPAMAKGEDILLDGRQAELFVRSRMTVADGTNASRMKRQRLYLESLLTKLFGENDPEGAPFEEALDAMQGHYETDMSESAVLSALRRYSGYEWKPFVELPGEYGVDEDGFTEFRLDERKTTEVLIEIWFR